MFYNFRSFVLITIFTTLISVSWSSREEECVEVGFARSSHTMVTNAFTEAKEEALKRWAREDKDNKPAYTGWTEQAKNVSRAALLLEATSVGLVSLIRKTRVGKRCPPEWLLKGVEKHVTPLINLDKELAESLGLVMSFRCMIGSPFPNVDGTCVNEQSPDMGANGGKFLRLLPPVAGKGGFSLRSSSNGEKSLPSASRVANLIRKHMTKPKVSALFREMSHFLALDMFGIPESPLTEGVDCCASPDHVDCDPFYTDSQDLNDPKNKAAKKCFNFKRSAAAQAILGHRESLSLISTYIDATPVYGSTNEIAFEHKEGYFGYLKYPTSLDEKEKKRRLDCKFPESFKGCLGIAKEDDTFIENLNLVLRLEHNAIADLIAEINPHFDDALLYNEARRYLIAELNHIVYGEFVPLMVGSEKAQQHSLLPFSEGPAAKFIAEVNPGVLTVHALAAHRNPAMFSEWSRDLGQTDLMSSLQYASVRDDDYQDLLAMDVQRGRDHGLTSYRAWRAFCDAGRHLDSWEDLAEIFSKEVIADLKELYQEEINDLDVLVALLEPAEESTYVGKTFGCILLDQYARLKTGNRLYWEHETSLFTSEQKDAIHERSSAAALLCRHFSLDKVAKNAFLPVSESNPLIDCESLLPLDLTAWKDTSLIEVMKKNKEEKEGKIEEPIEEQQKEEIKQVDEPEVEVEAEPELEIEAEIEAEAEPQVVVEEVVEEMDEMKAAVERIRQEEKEKKERRQRGQKDKSKQEL